MKTIHIQLFTIAIFSVLLPLRAEQAVDPAFAKLDQIFGQTGKALPGDVQKYTWPRKDLEVRVQDVRLEPGLAFGSWAAFKKTGSQVMTMGDLVLLPSEVKGVIEQLQAGGLQILAIHNHLMGESPQVIYVHFHGAAALENLAAALKNALTKTKTPMNASTAQPELAPETQLAFQTIQNVLGQKGTVSGKVLQINLPRKEKIEERGEEVPASMGMSTSMNFQTTANRVAATGDFVLIADEVNPVIKELNTHGIEVTALHTHMLYDNPHVFFMHFWALDAPEEVAAGLKAALSKVNTK